MCKVYNWCDDESLGIRILDLSGKKLTLDQKPWLANQVIYGTYTTIQIHKKRKIALNTIQKCVRIINGKKRKESGQKIQSNLFFYIATTEFSYIHENLLCFR